MTKKRKFEVDLDAERTLYSSFVSAANSVSQLYTQAVQQQRKSAATASRQTLERVICYVLKESAENGTLTASTLLQYLQQEYESVDSLEPTAQPNPVYHFVPVPSQVPGSSLPTGVDDSGQDNIAKLNRQGMTVGFTSPPRRGTVAMETTELDRHVMDYGQHLHGQPMVETNVASSMPGMSSLQEDGKNFTQNYIGFNYH